MADEKFPATRMVHTPSGPVMCCDKHAYKLTGLLIFLGTHVPQTLAPDGAECSNCKNEAAMSTPNKSESTLAAKEQA